MVKPKDSVKRRHLHYAHVTQSKGIMNSVMNTFKVANFSAVSLVAYLAIRLVGGEQLIDGITNISLLFAHDRVYVVVTASGIGKVRIEWISNSMLPFLELILRLSTVST